MDLANLRKKLRARLPDAIEDLRQRAHEHAPGAAGKREAGYTIANAADEAVIRIYDEIWFLGVNADDFVRDLQDVTAPRIRVEINSPGGDVFDGIAIYNALRTHPAHVTTRVDGIAASIASVIAQAGDHRIMLGASQMMIHNVWGMTVGNHRDHDEMAAFLREQDENLAGIYSSRSGGEADHFRALMDAETWMTAQRAIDEGLADELVDPPAKPQDRAPTLHDEISDALAGVSAATASAERVAALRAEAGKDLSVVNRESLAGLRDAIVRLDGLLTTEEDDWREVVNREFVKLVASHPMKETT